MVQFLEFLAEYRIAFIFMLDILIAVAIWIVWKAFLRQVRRGYDEARLEENQIMLRNIDYTGLGDLQKASMLRRAITSVNIDPGPNGYMIIEEAGREAFIRVFYIESCPKRVAFNGTFRELMNFPHCISEVNIIPIAGNVMSRKLDKNLIDIESEFLASDGDTNKIRKLRSKYSKKEKMALEVESGEEKYFYAMF